MKKMGNNNKKIPPIEPAATCVAAAAAAAPPAEEEEEEGEGEEIVQPGILTRAQRKDFLTMSSEQLTSPLEMDLVKADESEEEEEKDDVIRDPDYIPNSEDEADMEEDEGSDMESVESENEEEKEMREEYEAEANPPPPRHWSQITQEERDQDWNHVKLMGLPLKSQLAVAEQAMARTHLMYPIYRQIKISNFNTPNAPFRWDKIKLYHTTASQTHLKWLWQKLYDYVEGLEYRHNTKYYQKQGKCYEDILEAKEDPAEREKAHRNETYTPRQFRQKRRRIHSFYQRLCRCANQNKSLHEHLVDGTLKGYKRNLSCSQKKTMFENCSEQDIKRVFDFIEDYTRWQHELERKQVRDQINQFKDMKEKIDKRKKYSNANVRRRRRMMK